MLTLIKILQRNMYLSNHSEMLTETDGVVLPRKQFDILNFSSFGSTVVGKVYGYKSHLETSKRHPQHPSDDKQCKKSITFG